MKPVPQQLLTFCVSLALLMAVAQSTAAQEPAVDVKAGSGASGSPTAAPSQDAVKAEGSEQAVDPAGNKTEKSIGGMIVSGGILNVVFFGILGIFSLWAATVVLERTFHLRRDQLLPESFAQQLSQIVQVPQTNPVKFQQLCEGPTSPASRIFHAGVLRAGRSVPEVEKAMEDAASREMSALRARSRPLSVVGNIAPLVGLLGTVVGMIMAFQISSQEGLGKAERLAEGIYLALMTTAAGLTIAIPCLLFATWFHSRAERFMCDIDECLMESIPSFAQMEGQTSMSAGKPVAAPSEMSPRERFLSEGVTGTVQG